MAAALHCSQAAEIAASQTDPGLGVERATPEQLAALEKILARPEFQSADQSGLLEILLDPIRTALSAPLREMVRWLNRLGQASADVPEYALLLVALVIILGAAVVVARLSRGALAAEAELAQPATAGPPGAEAELARAKSLAQAGDLRGAVRHSYLAVLWRLDERGLLPFDRSLTNREHLSRASSSPAVAESLAPIVATFDRLWYGQRSCSSEDYANFAALAERVWQVSR